MALAGCGLLALGAGPAVASSPSCGATIAVTTTLHADLPNCPGDGLVIGSDNITLNLNGHTIDGDAIPGVTDADAGIRLAGHHGVALIGGTVQEFDTGVLLDAAPSNRLRGLTVLRNAPGRGIDLENHSDANDIEANTSASNARAAIAMVQSDHNLVRANTTRDNPAGGIIGHTASDNRIEHNTSPVGVDQGSNANVITGNSASGGEAGIAIDGDRNVATGNRVFKNCGDILVAGDNNTVVANLVRDPTGSADSGCGVGIAVEGGVSNLVASNSVARIAGQGQGIRVNAYEEFGGIPTIGTVIRGNLVRDSATDGIAIATDSGSGETVNDTVIEANLIIGSGNDGINIARAATTVTRNLAVHNANLGIEAIPGVIDGGGNRAFGNGNPAQCINIAC